MGVGPRHTRRMLAVYRERGAAALAHGHRGRRAPNATPDALAADVVHLAGTRYARANHTHLSELLSEREGTGLPCGSTPLSSPRQRRPPKHRVRPAHASEGMLIRWTAVIPVAGRPSTAVHAADRVDDATGTVVAAIFCQQEDAHNYFLLMQSLIRRVRQTRRPGPAVFRHTPGASLGCPPSSAVLWRSWGSR